MYFSGSAVLRRSDLLAIVSVLDLDTVLERAATIGAYRSGARSAVLAVLADASTDPAGGPGGHPRLLTYGVDEEEAAALRRRIGDAGLPATPEGRPTWRDPDVTRLHDPETGCEVLRLPVLVNGRVFADLLVADPPPDGFADGDVKGLAVLGRVTGVAVRNALSYALSERRREAVELAAAVDQSLRPPYRLDEPATRIAEGALRLSRARTAAVVTAGEHGVDVAAAAGGQVDELPRVLAVVADRARAAQAAGEEFTTSVDDLTVWGLPFSPEHAYRGVVVLVLDPEQPSVPDAGRALLTSFVRHGSLVLDHGVLQQQRQRAVLSADRDRIARDLHDVVIQRLYAAGLKLRAAGGGKGGPHPGTDLVAEVVRDLDDSIRDIRGTIFELERGHETSLRNDVVALGREYEPALGFAPVVRTWGPVDSMVERNLAEQATVVLREALANCARHAAASRCEVDVAVEAGWLVLHVADDGRGPGHRDGPRSGLRNLQARAEELGGTLVLEPAEPRGTRLLWRVPLSGQEASPTRSGTGSATLAPGTSADRSTLTSDRVSVDGVAPGSGQSHSDAAVSSTQERPAATR